MLTLDKDITSAPMLPRARDDFNSRAKQLPLPFTSAHTGPDPIATSGSAKPLRTNCATPSDGTTSID